MQERKSFVPQTRAVNKGKRAEAFIYTRIIDNRLKWGVVRVVSFDI